MLDREWSLMFMSLYKVQGSWSGRLISLQEFIKKGQKMNINFHVSFSGMHHLE